MRTSSRRFAARAVTFRIGLLGPDCALRTCGLFPCTDGLYRIRCLQRVTPVVVSRGIMDPVGKMMCDSCWDTTVVMPNTVAASTAPMRGSDIARTHMDFTGYH